MHPNGTKTHQNVSLGSNGLDRVRSLRKIPTRLRCTNFCTCSVCFAPSFVRQPNGSECTQMVQNAPKHHLRVNGVDRTRSLRKIPTRLRGTNFCTSSARFAPTFVSNQTVSNVPKWYKTHQNISLGSNGVDRARSLRKILTQLRGTNFCTSSARFAPCFVRQPNGPECTQMVRNTPKRQFKVKWGGSDAFVAKNSDATSWHEPLHLFGLFCTEFRKTTKRPRMHPNGTKHTKHHLRVQWGG